MEVTHSGRQFVFVPGNTVVGTTGWDPQTIHIVTRSSGGSEDNHRIVSIGEPITALRCNDTFAVASTAKGHLRIVSLATGAEVLKSDDVWTDGGAAFDCCFDVHETLICFGRNGKKGHLGVVTFNNDMAAPVVRWISECEIGSYKMRCATISEDGKMVACADEQGTYAYVVSVGDGKKFREFSRGSWPAKVLALRFSPKGEFLVLKSDHETYHLFGIGQDISNYVGWGGYVWSNEASKLDGNKEVSSCAIGVDYNPDKSFKLVALDSKLGGVSTDVLVLDRVLKFSAVSKLVVTIN